MLQKTFDGCASVVRSRLLSRELPNGLEAQPMRKRRIRTREADHGTPA